MRDEIVLTFEKIVQTLFNWGRGKGREPGGGGLREGQENGDGRQVYLTQFY